ncbi:hypothetical protein Tco_0995550 [Tanacetum coccineum]
MVDTYNSIHAPLKTFIPNGNGICTPITDAEMGSIDMGAFTVFIISILLSTAICIGDAYLYYSTWSNLMSKIKEPNALTKQLHEAGHDITGDYVVDFNFFSGDEK